MVSLGYTWIGRYTKIDVFHYRYTKIDMIHYRYTKIDMIHYRYTKIDMIHYRYTNIDKIHYRYTKKDIDITFYFPTLRKEYIALILLLDFYLTVRRCLGMDRIRDITTYWFSRIKFMMIPPRINKIYFITLYSIYVY
jgi:hypothetical protein